MDQVKAVSPLLPLLALIPTPPQQQSSTGTSTGITASTCGLLRSGSSLTQFVPFCHLRSGSTLGIRSSGWVWLMQKAIARRAWKRCAAQRLFSCRPLSHDFLAGNRFLVHRCGPSCNVCGGVLQSRHQRLPGAVPNCFLPHQRAFDGALGRSPP